MPFEPSLPFIYPSLSTFEHRMPLQGGLLDENVRWPPSLHERLKVELVRPSSVSVFVSPSEMRGSLEYMGAIKVFAVILWLEPQ